MKDDRKKHVSIQRKLMTVLTTSQNDYKYQVYLVDIEEKHLLHEF